MDSSTATALAAGTIIAIVLISIAVWVIYIIAFWKLFEKGGEKGWKAIIPIYNEYILYKISWKKSMFWIMLILAFVSGILVSMSGGDINAGVAGTGAAYYIGMILYFAVFVIYIIQNYKTSKAFGHGVGFCLGLIFFNFIFMMILGFGSSEYKGAQA